MYRKVGGIISPLREAYIKTRWSLELLRGREAEPKRAPVEPENVQDSDHTFSERLNFTHQVAVRVSTKGCACACFGRYIRGYQEVSANPPTTTSYQVRRQLVTYSNVNHRHMFPKRFN